MAAVELAQAYVSLIPSASGIGAGIAKELTASSGVEAAAAEAGTKASGSFGSTFTSGLKSAAVVGGAAVAGLAVGAVALGSSFDDAYDRIRTGTGATGGELEGLKDIFRDVVSEVPASFGDASTAISGVVSSLGDLGAPIGPLSSQLLELSRITETDLTTNMDAATGVLRGFAIPADQMTGSLDKLFVASQNSGVAVADIATQMSGAAPVLKAAGVGFDESAAIIATLAKAGLSAGDVMPALGKSLATAAKDGKPAGDVFRETFAAIQNAPDDTTAAGVAMDVFGAKAGPKFAEMVRDGTLSYEDLMATISAGGDTIMGAGADTSDWGEKLQVLGNKLMVTFEPLATTVFDALGSAIEWVGNTVDNLTKFFTDHKDVVIAVGTAIGVILVGGLIAYTAVQVAALASTIALAFATYAWLAPLILVIGIIAAVVAAVVYAWQNFDWFRNVVTGVWDAIVAAATWAWENVLKPIWEGISWYITNILIPYFQLWWAIVQAVWAGIVAVATWAWENVLKPIWDAIYGFIVNYLIPYYQLLWAVAQEVWNGIVSVVSWAWENVIKPIWDAIYGFITTYLVPYFQTLWSIAQQVWNGISSVISWAWENIIRPAFDAIKSAIGTVIDAFVSIKDGISNAFSTLADIIKAPFTTAFDAIKSLWNNTIGGFEFGVPDWIPFIGGKSFRIPEMHTGGIVPGPYGSERLAMLQAGEVVVPAHQAAHGVGSPGAGPAVLVQVTEPGASAYEIGSEVLFAYKVARR